MRPKTIVITPQQHPQPMPKQAFMTIQQQQQQQRLLQQQHMAGVKTATPGRVLPVNSPGGASRTVPWDIPINEFNCGNILDRMLASTQSMNKVLTSMQEDLHSIAKHGGVSEQFVRREIGNKLRRAMVAFKKSFDDITLSAHSSVRGARSQQSRSGASNQAQQARPVSIVRHGAPVNQNQPKMVLMRTSDGKLVRMPMDAMKNTSMRQAARSGVITHDQRRPVPSRQSSDVVVILSDSSDDESGVTVAKVAEATPVKDTSSANHSEVESESGKSGSKRKSFQLRVSLDKGGTPESKRRRMASGDDGRKKKDAELSDDGIALSERLDKEAEEAKVKSVQDREARRLLRQARRERDVDISEDDPKKSDAPAEKDSGMDHDGKSSADEETASSDKTSARKSKTKKRDAKSKPDGNESDGDDSRKSDEETASSDKTSARKSKTKKRDAKSKPDGNESDSDDNSKSSADEETASSDKTSARNKSKTNKRDSKSKPDGNESDSDDNRKSSADEETASSDKTSARNKSKTKKHDTKSKQDGNESDGDDSRKSSADEETASSDKPSARNKSKTKKRDAKSKSDESDCDDNSKSSADEETASSDKTSARNKSKTKKRDAKSKPDGNESDNDDNRKSSADEETASSDKTSARNKTKTKKHDAKSKPDESDSDDSRKSDEETASSDKPSARNKTKTKKCDTKSKQDGNESDGDDSRKSSADEETASSDKTSARNKSKTQKRDAKSKPDGNKSDNDSHGKSGSDNDSPSKPKDDNDSPSKPSSDIDTPSKPSGGNKSPGKSNSGDDHSEKDADSSLTNGLISDKTTNKEKSTSRNHEHNGDGDAKSDDDDDIEISDGDLLQSDGSDDGIEIADDILDVIDVSDASPVKDAFRGKSKLNGKDDDDSPSHNDRGDARKVVQVDGAPDRRDTSNTSDSSGAGIKHETSEDLFGSLSFEPLFEIQPMNSDDSNVEAESETPVKCKVKPVKRSRADIEAQRVMHKELLEDSGSQSDAVDATSDGDSDEDITCTDNIASGASSGDVYNPYATKEKTDKHRDKRDSTQGSKGEVTPS